MPGFHDRTFANAYSVTLYSDARVGVIAEKGGLEMIFSYWQGVWTMEEEVIVRV